MRAHNSDDQRIKLIHKFSRGRLIALANALQAASKVKGRLIRHNAMEIAAYTIDKTWAWQSGYSRSAGKFRASRRGRAAI
jgi:ferritin-like metal-binding protein YciE